MATPWASATSALSNCRNSSGNCRSGLKTSSPVFINRAVCFGSGNLQRFPHRAFLPLAVMETGLGAEFLSSETTFLREDFPLRTRVCSAVILLLTAVHAAVVGDDIPRSFQIVSDKPVFVAQPGAWDAKIRERGWIMQDGGLWKLWYTGYDPEQQPVTMKLGYATSKDGVQWSRAEKNPLVSDYWVEDMMVVKREGTYYMFSEGSQDQAQLMTSPDGIQWTRVGTLDVRLKAGEPIPAGPFGTPTAIYDDAVWYLFYERRDQGIWLATSADMKIWTNVSDDPVIVPGPEDFDRRMIAMNQVQKIGIRYVAVLHGTGDEMKPRRWATYLAESEDLVNWKKISGPLRPVSENKSSGLLIPDANRWRFYTTHDRIDLHMQE